mmetsp:Transcript_39386/g.102032  ORF Transcript_39386/g.102032 Transcript_39386/m.102032 type:complete len:362 (-) Transcript_39386:930-2015(-)
MAQPVVRHLQGEQTLEVAQRVREPHKLVVRNVQVREVGALPESIREGPQLVLLKAQAGQADERRQRRRQRFQAVGAQVEADQACHVSADVGEHPGLVTLVVQGKKHACLAVHKVPDQLWHLGPLVVRDVEIAGITGALQPIRQVFLVDISLLQLRVRRQLSPQIHGGDAPLRVMLGFLRIGLSARIGLYSAALTIGTLKRPGLSLLKRKHLLSSTCSFRSLESFLPLLLRLIWNPSQRRILTHLAPTSIAQSDGGLPQASSTWRLGAHIGSRLDEMLLSLCSHVLGAQLPRGGAIHPRWVTRSIQATSTAPHADLPGDLPRRGGRPVLSATLWERPQPPAPFPQHAGPPLDPSLPRACGSP